MPEEREYGVYAKAAMIFMSAVLLATVAQARSFTFAYIPHSTTDENFRTAKQGAVRAATEDGNAIREFGRGQAAHPRWQLKAIEEALSRGVDGIILAPLDARVLHEAMRHVPEAQRPPVVVIESDLPEKHHHYRVAYVGTNGVDMGRMMGRLAKRFRPQGGNIALMGSWEGHTSIQSRLWGIRATLGGREAADNGRLTGQNGWMEVKRSPWLCRDNYTTALNQMESSLQDPETDVFIAAGWWPQMSENYGTVVSRFKPDIASGRKVVIVGDGVDLQQQYLLAGLATANVTQDFLSMGRTAYNHLLAAVKGGTPPQITYTPTKPLFPKGR